MENGKTYTLTLIIYRMGSLILKTIYSSES